MMRGIHKQYLGSWVIGYGCLWKWGCFFDGIGSWGGTGIGFGLITTGLIYLRTIYECDKQVRQKMSEDRVHRVVKSYIYTR
jgi:hypothetical protein